ncbi:MAG: hypothetical protein C5B57_07430 [Blastocatellia bacterium]|nr:MAG: hypothetical protein C5B57_07430 [Blastocatellia bacterium]
MLEGTHMEQTFEIIIDQLVADEEFRHCFLRNPRGTLRLADDWGLPLCDSEIRSLMSTGPSVWDRFAEELDARTSGSDTDSL